MYLSLKLKLCEQPGVLGIMNTWNQVPLTPLHTVLKNKISFKTLPAGLFMTFFKHWMTETLEKLTPLTTVSYQEKSLSTVE